MARFNSVNTIPPSAMTVLRLLDEGGSMTHKDLVSRCSLAPRTIRYALKALKDEGLIQEKFNFQDARQVLYEKKAVSYNDDQDLVSVYDATHV